MIVFYSRYILILPFHFLQKKKRWWYQFYFAKLLFVPFNICQNFNFLSAVYVNIKGEREREKQKEKKMIDNKKSKINRRNSYAWHNGSDVSLYQCLVITPNLVVRSGPDWSALSFTENHPNAEFIAPPPFSCIQILLLWLYNPHFYGAFAEDRNPLFAIFSWRSMAIGRSWRRMNAFTICICCPLTNAHVRFVTVSDGRASTPSLF